MTIEYVCSYDGDFDGSMGFDSPWAALGNICKSYSELSYNPLYISVVCWKFVDGRKEDMVWSLHLFKGER